MTYGYFIVVRNQSTFVASLVVLFRYEKFIISTELEGGAYVGIDAVKSPASDFLWCFMYNRSGPWYCYWYFVKDEVADRCSWRRDERRRLKVMLHWGMRWSHSLKGKDGL